MDLPGPADPEADSVDFDAVIDDVLDGLPDAFLERLGSVAIVVEDEATPEQLASVGAGGLYGLYQGVPRTRFGVDNAPIPSKITLFRGPLSRSHRTPERLAAAIEDTLLHEIAHHFGIDDDRLRELRTAGEDRPANRRRRTGDRRTLRPGRSSWAPPVSPGTTTKLATGALADGLGRSRVVRVEMSDAK